VGTSVLPPVATDARPHRVRVYRSPEWDPRTTARVEVAVVGGLMAAMLLTYDRWDSDRLCRTFTNAPDETTPKVSGMPFTWLGLKGGRWFRDWRRSYAALVPVMTTARTWLPDRFGAHAQLGGLTHSLRP